MGAPGAEGRCGRDLETHACGRGGAVIIEPTDGPPRVRERAAKRAVVPHRTEGGIGPALTAVVGVLNPLAGRLHDDHPLALHGRWAVVAAVAGGFAQNRAADRGRGLGGGRLPEHLEELRIVFDQCRTALGRQVAAGVHVGVDQRDTANGDLAGETPGAIAAQKASVFAGLRRRDHPERARRIR